MHSAFYTRCFQIVTVAVLGYLVYETLAPLRSVLGWAVVLAFILYPLHERLAKRLGGRDTWSAAILTGLTPFLVLAPLSVLGVVFAGQVSRLVTYLRGTSFPSPTELLNRLSGYPVIGGAVDWVRENAAVSAAEVQGWVTDSLQSLLKSAAAMGGSVALGVFGTVVSFFLMLFMLFYFLKDGRAMLDGLIHLIPVEPTRRAKLRKYLSDVTRAVVFGSTTTALIAGLIVGTGFAIVGLPSPVVFGVLATIAGFLPVGAAIVLIPAALERAFTGHWGAAIFLACWTVGMWIVETLVRPLLTAQRAEVSTLAVFIGAIGGVSAFGILGLIIGPVLLSFVVALVRFAQESLPADA